MARPHAFVVEDPARDRLRADIAAGIDRLVADIGRDGAAALCTRFLDDLPIRLGCLEAAIADNDLEDVRVGAHNLAGICGTFGAQRLGDTAHQVEKRCIPPDQPTVELLHDLDSQARQVAAILKEHMAAPAG